MGARYRRGQGALHEIVGLDIDRMRDAALGRQHRHRLELDDWLREPPAQPGTGKCLGLATTSMRYPAGANATVIKCCLCGVSLPAERRAGRTSADKSPKKAGSRRALQIDRHQCRRGGIIKQEGRDARQRCIHVDWCGIKNLVTADAAQTVSLSDTDKPLNTAARKAC